MFDDEEVTEMWSDLRFMAVTLFAAWIIALGLVYVFIPFFRGF